MTHEVIAMRTALRLLAAALLLAAAPAAASPLDDAKQAGQLGEQADGFVGVVPGAPASAKRLADEINAARATRYQEIAAENGTSPVAVGVLAGEKLIERTPPGQWVRGKDGKWTQR